MGRRGGTIPAAAATKDRRTTRRGDRMKRSFAALLAISGLVPLLLVSGALSRAGAPVPSAHAGRLGIDDELSDEQERLLSGFAAFELAKSGNDNPGGPQSTNNYF